MKTGMEKVVRVLCCVGGNFNFEGQQIACKALLLMT